jgi:hypothetical protein
LKTKYISEGVDIVACLRDLTFDGFGDELLDELPQVNASRLPRHDLEHLPDCPNKGALDAELRQAKAMQKRQMM